jgi:hypothetical protein
MFADGCHTTCLSLGHTLSSPSAPLQGLGSQPSFSGRVGWRWAHCYFVVVVKCGLLHFDIELCENGGAHGTPPYLCEEGSHLVGLLVFLAVLVHWVAITNA